MAEITGTGARDTLAGTAGADVISGDNGSDTIFAGAGDDIIYGFGAAAQPGGPDAAEKTFRDSNSIRRVISRLKRLKESEVASRGLGKSIGTIALITPGRAVMIVTLSDR